MQKSDAQKQLDRIYAYLVEPMTTLKVPYYLRGASRWNGTVAALSVIASVYLK